MLHPVDGLINRHVTEREADEILPCVVALRLYGQTLVVGTGVAGDIRPGIRLSRGIGSDDAPLNRGKARKTAVQNSSRIENRYSPHRHARELGWILTRIGTGHLRNIEKDAGTCGRL